MKIRSKIIKPIAKVIANRIDRWKRTAVADQEHIRRRLVERGRNTVYGKEHQFDKIGSSSAFSTYVPLIDYEGLKPYIDRIKQGERNILWPGRPKYFAKTSGTTSGVKYIPLTRDSMPNHFGSARNALLNYAAKTGKAGFFDGKMIFLSGSPELDTSSVIPTGRLSGIVNHEVPAWLRKSQVPSYNTNCIEDWELKVDAIVKETVNLDMRLISGIPPWVQMYLERLLEVSGKKDIMHLFPNFSMFVYGGVNYEPYRNTLEKLFGTSVDSVETFPASEGFFAFQDEQDDSSLLLNTQSGIYFEFVELEEMARDKPTRVPLEGVRIGVPYAIIVNNNAGLWGYNIGDVVTFTSVDPYKIVFTGRVTHYISAFGEHVIGKEVEDSLKEAIGDTGVKIAEFSVAPQVNPGGGRLPFHEWLIEFEVMPADLEAFRLKIDSALARRNIYYNDLITGNILQTLQIVPLKKGSFITYMRENGKLGGQNKVPRLTNDREIADALHEINNR
ncbi:MAG TPA: GH3 auxin-responsive promoter family protein [Saprospiraceae bacterium]|nr:GH3 auxin-responsive promoter family protein [Saprospiraceae bacterium]